MLNEDEQKVLENIDTDFIERMSTLPKFINENL